MPIGLSTPLSPLRTDIPVLGLHYHNLVWIFFSTAQECSQYTYTSFFSFTFQHLIERSWYAVTETCLAFTVFRDDFSPRFVAQFTLLLFLKCFHWLAEDRVDYMERSPLLTWLFHVRAILLLLFLGIADAVLVHIAYNTVMQSGASVQLVFGFEVRPEVLCNLSSVFSGCHCCHETAPILI